MGRRSTRPVSSGLTSAWVASAILCLLPPRVSRGACPPRPEDVALGSIPGLLPPHLHSAVLSYTVGDEFMAPFHQAAAGKLPNFVLVMEGSIPNEKLAGEGYWSGFRC